MAAPPRKWLQTRDEGIEQRGERTLAQQRAREEGNGGGTTWCCMRGGDGGKTHQLKRRRTKGNRSTAGK